MWSLVKENKGLVIWLCGLAGSGKSTIGRKLYTLLKDKIKNVVYLDGDELRDLLGHYGYDRDGRIEVALKRSQFAHFLSNQGLVVIVTTISMFDEVYRYNRDTLENYLEVYIKCSMDELNRRDQKCLYSDALVGKIKNVVGVDIAFNEPKADIIVENSENKNLSQKAHYILSFINTSH